MDYLTPIYIGAPGIYFKKTSIQEEPDLTVFKQPFSGWTWIVLFSSIFLSSCIVFILKVSYLKQLWSNIIGIVATTLKSYLGAGDFSFLNIESHSLHFITFTILLTGTLWDK